MAELQARLHQLPTDGCPLPYDRPFIDRFLDEPRVVLAKYPSPAPERALAWLDERADLVRDEEPVLIHGDLHPVNIVSDGDTMTLLDWPDAALGDRHADVARTLAVFSLAADFERSRLTRMILKTLRPYIVSRYLREYRKHLKLSKKRLRYWEAAHALSEWVTVETMERHGEAAIGGREGVSSEIPAGFSLALARYFEKRSGFRTGAQDAHGS
jgi:aminoglycoside phosphotransferase (APT) family kinase protein